MSIYLFNPENDLALANFSANYMPPASAVRMAREMALIPIWYAGSENRFTGTIRDAIGDPQGLDGKSLDMDGGSPGVTVNSRENEEGVMVLAEGKENVAFLERMKELFDLKVSLIPMSSLASYPDAVIVPWGWNPSLVRTLQASGVSECQLPSMEELEQLWGYTHRRHAVETLAALRSLDERLTGEPRYVTSVEELLAYLELVPGDKVLKMPLSGSGKGLIWILGGITDKQVDWCRRVIRGQGGVVVEPIWDRIRDFAMEFWLDNGTAKFAGYSLFQTAASGAYMGNELLTDARIEELLGSYLPISLFHQLRESLLQLLSNRFPRYRGYVGVDMMVCATSEEYKAHPCVEINMRMNMGVVSHTFYERHVQPDAEGMFTVDYFKRPGVALSFHRKMEREHPLTVKDNKIVSGYLPLTPVTEETRYMAYAVIG
ncbi:MAG: hypothetical protein QM237_00605 [Bacteroidota bacterium]|jgi:hypothetical protein|nr:hypothetical protein [Bacteroidota bacterium]